MVLVEFKDTEAERQFWLFISACNYKARLYGTGPSLDQVTDQSLGSHFDPASDNGRCLFPALY